MVLEKNALSSVCIPLLTGGRKRGGSDMFDSARRHMLEENARQKFRDIGFPESYHVDPDGIDITRVGKSKKVLAVAFPLWERVFDASFDDVLGKYSGTSSFRFPVLTFTLKLL
jgi:hypothetical protein